MLAVGHWSSAYYMYKEGTRPDDVLICLSAEVDNTMISVDNQWYSPPSRAEKYLMSDIRAYRHWYASGCKIISTHRACILFTSGLYDLITYWYVFRQKVINSDKLISSPNHIYVNLDFSDNGMMKDDPNKRWHILHWENCSSNIKCFGIVRMLYTQYRRCL